MNKNVRRDSFLLLESKGSLQEYLTNSPVRSWYKNRPQHSRNESPLWPSNPDVPRHFLSLSDCYYTILSTANSPNGSAFPSFQSTESQESLIVQRFTSSNATCNRGRTLVRHVHCYVGGRGKNDRVIIRTRPFVRHGYVRFAGGVRFAR